MTTKELIELLRTYPEDSQVVVEWDGGHFKISKELITFNENIVVIDASEWGSS